MRKYVLEPNKSISFLRELPRNMFYLLFSIKNARTDIQNKRIAEFYKTYRDAPEDVDLADVDTGHLTEPLRDVLNEKSTVYDRIVDLGCGKGTIANFVTSTDTTYIGIDLIITAESDRKNCTFIEAPINEDLRIEALEKTTLFIASNLVCYMPSEREITAFLANNSRLGDYLLVIEPCNPLLWETCFFGIKIKIRKKEEIVRLVSRSKFALDASTGVYLFSWGRFFFLKISNVILFQKTMK